MTTKLWVAAWNYPTRTWSSGGDLSEYARPHWDHYLVPARSHSEALKAGRALRSKQQNLTAAQAQLLASLRREHAAAPASIREECPWVWIDAHEAKAARSLEAKGLLTITGADGRNVRLTVSAFNQLPAVDALLASSAAAA